MTAAFAITVLATAWVVTLALLFITLSGSAQMLDDERKLTDRYKAERDAARAARRVVEAALRAEQRANARLEAEHAPARSLFVDSPAAQRITNLLAANESARFDPDTQDWSA